MKPRIAFIGMVVVIVLFGLALGADRAQGDSPGTPMLAGATATAGGAGGGISIQGRLTDANGNPLNGSVSLTAGIYDVPSGGVARCSDTQSVAVTGGLFLMSINTCTSANINGDPLWLGLKVGADPEMTPRQAIGPIAYAMSLRPGAIVNGDVSILGKLGVGTSSPDRTLTIANATGANYMNLKDGAREILMGVDAGGGILSVMSNHDLSLRTGFNSEKMRITAGGSVGIGTSNPVSGTLDVRSLGHSI
jgi:hypothetical protein